MPMSVSPGTCPSCNVANASTAHHKITRYQLYFTVKVADDQQYGIFSALKDNNVPSEKDLKVSTGHCRLSAIRWTAVLFIK